MGQRRECERPRREAHEGGSKCAKHLVVLDATGQLPVKLDEIRGELQDMGKTCKACTGVVDGK
jgi:cytochrome c556